MPVLYLFEFKKNTVADFEKMSARFQAASDTAAMPIFRVAAEGDDGKLLIASCFESEAAAERFFTKIDKVIDELGLEKRPQPRKYRVHDILSGDLAAR